MAALRNNRYIAVVFLHDRMLFAWYSVLFTYFQYFCTAYWFVEKRPDYKAGIVLRLRQHKKDVTKHKSVGQSVYYVVFNTADNGIKRDLFVNIA